MDYGKMSKNSKGFNMLLLLGIICAIALFAKDKHGAVPVIVDKCIVLGAEEASFTQHLSDLGYHQRKLVSSDGQGTRVDYSSDSNGPVPYKYPRKLILEFDPSGRLTCVYGTANTITVRGHVLVAGISQNGIVKLLGAPSVQTRLPNDCTALVYKQLDLRLVVDNTQNYGLSGVTLGRTRDQAASKYW